MNCNPRNYEGIRTFEMLARHNTSSFTIFEIISTIYSFICVPNKNQLLLCNNKHIHQLIVSLWLYYCSEISYYISGIGKISTTNLFLPRFKTLNLWVRVVLLVFYIILMNILLIKKKLNFNVAVGENECWHLLKLVDLWKAYYLRQYDGLMQIAVWSVVELVALV